MQRVSCITAPFDVLYGTYARCATNPEMLAVFTMAPPPCSLMCGTTCFDTNAYLG
jgi:hypothetical protein